MFYRACEKCGERWLIGEASSCTCPADKPQEQRIKELEAALDVALEAMGLVGADLVCEASHHKKHDRHEIGEPCPVQKRWHEAFAKLKEMRRGE